MYFCIFGFHRLVWWPKCTPASRSSFIVSVAMALSPFRLASDPERRGPDRASRSPASTAETEARDRASWWQVAEKIPAAEARRPGHRLAAGPLGAACAFPGILRFFSSPLAACLSHLRSTAGSAGATDFSGGISEG